MSVVDQKAVTREILLAFWKVHILHHAGEEPVVGQWMLAELRRHGYDISPGTLYPLLKRMETNGWLRSAVEPGGGARAKRYYTLTAGGRQVLEVVRTALAELQGEVAEGKPTGRRPSPTARRAGRKREQ